MDDRSIFMPSLVTNHQSMPMSLTLPTLSSLATGGTHILVFLNPGKGWRQLSETNCSSLGRLETLPVMQKLFLIGSTAPQPTMHLVEQILVDASDSYNCGVYLIWKAGKADATHAGYKLCAACQAMPSGQKYVDVPRLRHCLTKSLISLFWSLVKRHCYAVRESHYSASSKYEYKSGCKQGHTRCFTLRNPATGDCLLSGIIADMHRFRMGPMYLGNKVDWYKAPSCFLNENRPKYVSIHEVRRYLTEYSPYTPPYIARSATFTTFKERMESERGLKARLLAELSAMEDIYTAACECLGYHPYRERWLDIFTFQCLVSKDTPCGECRGCRGRMCQAAMVVLAAQGVGDSVVLPHMGAVFRHPRYKNLSLEEWNLVTINEKAAVFKSCSKHCLCAYHFHYFVKECIDNKPPTHLEDICCFRGFSKKSGCLYLFAVYSIQFGIPTDSHVQDTAFKLGWTPYAGDEVATSCALELWVPPTFYERANIWPAGLRQLLSISAFATLALETCARRFGNRHQAVLHSMRPKLLKQYSPANTKDCPSLTQLEQKAVAVVENLKTNHGWKALIHTQYCADKPVYQMDIRQLFVVTRNAEKKTI